MHVHSHTLNHKAQAMKMTILILKYLKDGVPKATNDMEVKENYLLDNDDQYLRSLRYKWFRKLYILGYITSVGKKDVSKYAKPLLWQITAKGLAALEEINPSMKEKC